jgi:serine/threonine protein kinase
MANKRVPLKTLVDRYELSEIIGEGGMGTVYAALDKRTGRTVAVKILTIVESRPKYREQINQRFAREVLAISRIEHRFVVKITDWGVLDEDRPYMVMEYLHGVDLAKHLEGDESLKADYVVDMMLEVCSAVRACHERGIIHRDLKPQNIFLETKEQGHGWEVKLLDFGVAKGVVSGELTGDGQLVGTMKYLSPEQVAGKATFATDQYGIGVLLYHCLTKTHPYSGLHNAELLDAIKTGKFPPPSAYRPDLSPGLEAIILKAMSRVEEERFESAYALGQALLEHASPLGQSTWRKFYSHSPAPPRLAPQPTSSIPASILERIGAVDDAPTAIMTSRGRTARIPAAESPLSPSQVSLLAPTTPPAPPSEVDWVPAVRQRDKDEYSHLEGGEPIEDPSGAATIVSGERSAEWFEVSSPDALNVSKPAASAARASTEERSGKAIMWLDRFQGRRLQLGLGAAVALLCASAVVLLVHRPEEHLIHPVQLSQPPAAANPVARPPAPPEHAAATPTPPTAPGASAKAPVTDLQTASSVVPTLDEVPPSNDGRQMDAARSPRHHHKAHPAAEEVTPDGVPLVR